MASITVKLRQRGEVDLRMTSYLRVKHLTRPAAQVLEWTRAHMYTCHTYTRKYRYRSEFLLKMCTYRYLYCGREYKIYMVDHKFNDFALVRTGDVASESSILNSCSLNLH